MALNRSQDLAPFTQQEFALIQSNEPAKINIFAPAN